MIIPARNEATNIGQVVDRIRQAARYADVLVINDGSDDTTASAARQAGAAVLDLPFHLGIGGAVQAGFKFARDYGYPFAVRLDGDGQHNPDDIPRLLSTVMQGEADVAIGSRFCHGEQTYRPPFARRLGILFFSGLVSVLVGQRITDTTSGFQCLNRRAIEWFARYYPQDYPEVEAHILMSKVGLKVKEVPVQMRPRQSGSSSIGYLRSIYYVFKVTLATLIACLRARPRPYRSLNFREKTAHVSDTTRSRDPDQLVPADDHIGISS